MGAIGGIAAVAQILGRKPCTSLGRAKLNVVRRIEPVDFIALQERRFQHARGNHVRNLVNLRQEFERTLGGGTPTLEVTKNTLPQTGGFADIQYVSAPSQEAVHTGLLGQSKPPRTVEGKFATFRAAPRVRLAEPKLQRCPRRHAQRVEQRQALAPDESGCLYVPGRTAHQFRGMSQIARERANASPRQFWKQP